MTNQVDRRNFLTTGLAAGAGLAATAPHRAFGRLFSNDSAVHSPSAAALPDCWAEVAKIAAAPKEQAITTLLGRTLLWPSDAVKAPLWRKDADLYRDHQFNLLGSGWCKVYYGMKARGFSGHNYSDTSVRFDEVLAGFPADLAAASRRTFEVVHRLNSAYVPIDWHIDFKSGMRFSAIAPQKEFKYGVTPGVDAKVPFDLGRCYQTVRLALAYHGTGDAQYAEEVVCQILDWIAMNPFQCGAAWNASMNVAIRVTNWMVAVHLIRSYLAAERRRPEIDFFLGRFLLSCQEHGRFLVTDLELPEAADHPNHYIASICGMLVLAAGTQGVLSSAGDWAAFAAREMEHESRTQVLADGMNFECATGYQAFVLEMFITAGLIAANAASAKTAAEHVEFLRSRIGVHFAETMNRMFKFLGDAIKPNGHIPLLGDHDSGRFLNLNPPETEGIDKRPLAYLGAALFGRQMAIPPAQSLATRLLLGDRTAEAASPPAGGAAPVSTSRDWTTSGCYVMRHEDTYCFISCGPVGTNGRGGHTHNDKLAFELTVRGREIFVDPGVYAYTATLALRNEARATRNHNTLAVAGAEQNQFATDNPWWGCRDETRCRCLKWSVGDKKDEFVGDHAGYLKLKPPIVHRRQISLDKVGGALAVCDTLIVKGAVVDVPKLEWNFMLHPDCAVRRASEGCVLTAPGDLKITFTHRAGDLRIEEGWFSPEYGVKLPSKRLVIESAGIAGNEFHLRW